ncbi:hypothetical protein HWV62_33487 [Athelia sp. TMB]|nr:hypothetical protein HWV62_33487 [Athelia sp. TMB]
MHQDSPSGTSRVTAPAPVRLPKVGFVAESEPALWGVGHMHQDWAAPAEDAIDIDNEVEDSIENSAIDICCDDSNGDDDDDAGVYKSDGEDEGEGDDEDMGPEDGDVEANVLGLLMSYDSAADTRKAYNTHIVNSLPFRVS